MKVKQNTIIILCIVFITSFSIYKTTNFNFANQKTPLITNHHQLQKLFITGDFNGDGEKDTLSQNTIIKNTKISVDSFPENQWDSIQNYFSKINAEVILTLSKPFQDTLFLGTGGGVYCLINIGDNNNDKIDEIAVVVDYYDFTNISTCLIYSLCNKQWTLLKTFKIHEDAFIFSDDSTLPFNQIKGYLEYRNKTWYYIDYIIWFNAKNTKDTVLKPLKLKSCEYFK